MAKVRIGFSTHFEVENETVGIGTDSALDTLHVTGDIIADNIDISKGITTVTAYKGFIGNQVKLSNNINLDSEVHTLSDEIVIEGDITVSTGTTFTSGPDSLTVTNNFTLPGISDAEPTIGTMRFNENLGSLEFYTGVEWKVINSYVDMGNRGRGLYMGGNPGTAPHSVADIDYVEMATLGDAIKFGDLVVARDGPAMGQVSSSVRGIAYGGHNNPQGGEDEIDYVTIASAGKGTDFGNAQQATGWGAGCSSSTRGFKLGGYVGGAQANIEYIEIATAGTSYDWGADIMLARESCNGFSSPTRGFIAAGMNGSTVTGTIEVLTMASKGTATVEFGEMVGKRRGVGTLSNNVRGVMAGGRYSDPQLGVYTSAIDVVTMSSDGNTQYFGELTQGRRKPAGVSNQTRGVFASGYVAPLQVSTIDYITIDTAGNALDFGDLFTGRNGCGCASDSHGGLGGF